MSPIPHRQLHKRFESGSTFAVGFGIVAVVLIVAGVIWKFVLPEYRKERRYRSNRDTCSIFTSRKRGTLKKNYPSHPAVRPLLSSASPAQVLPTYNPRTESPFPDGSCGYTTSTRTRSTPAPSASFSSNGLFTPVKRNSLGDDDSKNKFHTVPRATDAKHFVAKSTDFGDAKDFILAVPEPLVLRPREAGRPPAVIRHLQKQDKGISMSPASSDRHLHPNKLFRALQGPDVRGSYCSSTSMRVDHHHSDQKDDVTAQDVVDIVDKAIQDGANQNRFTQSTLGDILKEEVQDDANAQFHALSDNTAAVHRLRSYQSLTGGEAPQLARTGTITIPKTPVDELRKLYNQEQQSVIPQIHRLPRGKAESTIPTSTDIDSEYSSDSTPATSPVTGPSNLKLLPVPLRTKKSLGYESNADSEASSCRTTESATYSEDLRDGGLPYGKVDHRGLIKKAKSGFYHTGRRLTKPAPLNVDTGTNELVDDASDPYRSFTDFGHAAYDPLVNSNAMRSRARASSMYSRDTSGLSLANTPITPDFPTPTSDGPTDPYGGKNPFKSQESVKSRINEWTQRIEGSAVPSLPRLRKVSPLPESSTSYIDDAAQMNSLKQTEVDDNQENEGTKIDTHNSD